MPMSMSMPMLMPERERLVALSVGHALWRERSLPMPLKR
jgi:hypothetical protein